MAAVDEIPLGGSKHGSKGEDTQNYATEAIKSGLSNVKVSTNFKWWYDLNKHI